MAAPLLRNHQHCLFTFLSRKSDSEARFLSIFRKCLAKAKVSRKQKNLAAASVSSTSGDVRESIEIPNKITRSPTAILEALARTVRNNTNKPVYQNIDDPTLVSRSDNLLRYHMAALDSGRSAAKMMIETNPEHYTHFWDESVPKAFDTVLADYKYEDPCEEALVEMIDRRKVADSIQLYKAIKSQDGKISQSTLEQFLDLLTVFNHEDPVERNDIYNFINPAFGNDTPFPASTWPKESFAEEVFNSLPEKSTRAYCSLIRGMAENFDVEKSLAVYKEARAAGIKVDVLTFNSLLSGVSLGLETMDEIKEGVEILLTDMAASNVTPNVGTFNSILINCRRVSRWRHSKQYAMSVLSEMAACGIEPSLETWLEIVKIFYYFKDNRPCNPNLFVSMLEAMDGKSFELQRPRDLLFFGTAMKIIYSTLTDSELALKLHSILKAHRNFDLIGNRQLKYSYFSNFFLTVAPVEHTDLVMDIYDSVVPYIFSPPSDVINAILKNIEAFDTYHYIPQIYPHLDHSPFFIQKGAVPLFSVMALKKNEPQLQQQFCDLASAFLLRWRESRLNRIRPYLDGKVIGDMILIYLHGDHVQQALSTLQIYKSDRNVQMSDPSDQSLQALTEAVITSKDFASSKELLTLMSSLDCEGLPQLVSMALHTFELSDQERNFLEGFSTESSSSSSSSDSSSDSD